MSNLDVKLAIIIANAANWSTKAVLHVWLHVANKFVAGQNNVAHLCYIISGRGRKSGVARATEATASLAPLG